MKKNKQTIEITNQIYIIREQKVILDTDLAELYGVTVKRINEQVKRNRERLPDDFYFKLSINELADIKSQSATCSALTYRKGMTPTVFTEQGAYALSLVLSS
jgi:hypothetical protein